MKKGKLITLEGGEGAGKTTVLSVIQSVIASWGFDYYSTREPGGHENSEKIRDILLNSDHLDAKTELLLMFASRNELVQKVIKPKLNAGTWVVSDRYVDASYAYQGGGRGLGFDIIKWMDKFVVGETQSDLTILLDIDPELGMSRVAKRGQKDRIEKEGIEFFKKIRASYLEKAGQKSEKYIVVDASKSKEEVAEYVINSLNTNKHSLI